ncbi:MAG TPA: anti-sigma factor [Mycobacteriales bacterium]|nr:anti-sigma factor [Mycobacteriales bacterium]
MRVFRRRALVCRQAVALVTGYLEDALSRADRIRFERHLAACPHCSAYLEQIRMMIALTGRIEPESLDRQVQDELITLYRQWQAG